MGPCGCGMNRHRSINGPRHQARRIRSIGGRQQTGRACASVHVTPRPITVSERPKTVSKVAVSGLPFTVSFLIIVLSSS